LTVSDDDNIDTMGDIEQEGHDSVIDDILNGQPSTKSTKQPIQPRPRSLKKKIQEEELQVMKGLACSISQHNKENETKRAKPAGEYEAFGDFIIESLKKLDDKTCHIVQYHINNILFQAQMAMLVDDPNSNST
jgi:hypothetical protein